MNGRVYVGQSVHIKRRWSEHRVAARRGDKSPLYISMRKHGLDAFALEILEECGPESFDERETHWMAHFRAREVGYNLMPAGQRGRVADEEMRERIASKLRGRKLTPEHIANISKGQTGRTHSEETKQKIRASGRARQRSPESAAKTALGLRKRYAAFTPEQRAEYSARRSGWRQTEEAKRLASEKLSGLKRSPEQIANMKASACNRNPEAEARRLAALREAFARKRAARQA